MGLNTSKGKLDEIVPKGELKIFDCEKQKLEIITIFLHGCDHQDHRLVCGAIPREIIHSPIYIDSGQWLDAYAPRVVLTRLRNSD